MNFRQQYPAVSYKLRETRDDSELGVVLKQERTIDFLISGFVKGAN